MTTPAEKLAAKVKNPSRGRMAIHYTLDGRCCLASGQREAVGLTQAIVSREIGIALSTLSKIERGDSPTLRTAFKLADFYGMTIEELWPKTDAQDPGASP